jgi:hypothetical protein
VRGTLRQRADGCERYPRRARRGGAFWALAFGAALRALPPAFFTGAADGVRLTFASRVGADPVRAVCTVALPGRRTRI